MWRQVLDILELLPNIRTLDISANHFDQPLDIVSTNAKLDALLIDSSPGLAWTDVGAIVNQLHVRSLSFGWSNLALLQATELDSLEELSLEYNCISDIQPLAQLPHLHSLNLRGNTELTALPPIHPPAQFASLRVLNLSHTGISSWAGINSLMSLPGLHTLHLGQTPVNMKNEGHALVDRSRAMVVGRLASIRKLDGTAVSTEERNELERYYLALSTKHQGDASVDFPRLEELIAIHGAPRKATGAHDAKIKSRLVAVTIQVMRAQRVESETRRSLLKSMLVRQLNPIAMKLTKSLAFQLFVSADGDDSHWTHLDNDARPLSFYGVESDGAVIRVQVDG